MKRNRLAVLAVVLSLALMAGRSRQDAPEPNVYVRRDAHPVMVLRFASRTPGSALLVYAAPGSCVYVDPAHAILATGQAARADLVTGDPISAWSATAVTGTEDCATLRGRGF